MIGIVLVARACFDQPAMDEGIGVDGLRHGLLPADLVGRLADILDRLAESCTGVGDLLSAAGIGRYVIASDRA